MARENKTVTLLKGTENELTVNTTSDGTLILPWDDLVDDEVSSIMDGLDNINGLGDILKDNMCESYGIDSSYFKCEDPSEGWDCVVDHWCEWLADVWDEFESSGELIDVDAGLAANQESIREQILSLKI